MKIYIHVGASKCASTSIQKHFSNNFEHAQQDGLLGYASIDKNGMLISGKALQLTAIQSPVGYASTSKEILDKKDDIQKALAQCAEKYSAILLSCEGWHDCHEDFRAIEDVFAPYEVEFIFIIRPVVLWYNSAWWQWFNWSENFKDVDSWIEWELNKRGERTSLWLRDYHALSTLSFTKKVHLLSLQSNIIEQIYKLMNIEYLHKEEGEKIANASSSAEHLYFLCANKDLRTLHDSAVDFVLGRHFKKRSPTPWVLSRDNLLRIFEKSKPAYEEIAQYISNENILENPQWFKVAAYTDKLAKFTRDTNLTKDIIVDMLQEANLKIIELENKLNPKDINMKMLADAYRKIEILDAKLREKNTRKYIEDNNLE